VLSVCSMTYVGAGQRENPKGINTRKE
jgi:hypothetical protein